MCEACGESSRTRTRVPRRVYAHHVRELFVIGAKQTLAQNFYSLIAGFVEGSESLEDAWRGRRSRRRRSSSIPVDHALAVFSQPVNRTRTLSESIDDADSAPPSSPIVSVR